MKRATISAAGIEIRDVLFAVRGELASEPAGPVLVSGMLADQLARGLSAGAEPGAVVVGGDERLGRAAAAVRVIAGDPSEEDDTFVRAADEARAAVVLVQLWPQAEWTRPYVLTPFVVECRPGEGFPVGAIADRIAEASERRRGLAVRVPVLRDAVGRRIRREGIVRAGLIGLAGDLLGASRPLLVLEQVRMVSRLAALRTGSVSSAETPLVAGIAAAGLAGGVTMRELARTARLALPAPLVNATVATVSTWALALAVRRLARIEPSQ